jgi:hypothetical protein
MGKKRKILAILVSLCFMFTVAVGMTPATYRAEQDLPTDISGHWAEASIITMLNTGVIGGYPDGTFKPNNPITRAEFTTIVNKAFGTFDAGAEAFFTDVKKSDWYYSQVASGKKAGFISGFPDGSFRPNSAITREQATAILASLLKLPGKDGALQFNDADKVAAWARGSVKAVTDAKIVSGYPDGTFKPLRPVTRAETVVIVQRALAIEKPPVEPITPSSLEVKVTANGKALDKATVNIFVDGTYEVFKTGTTNSQGIFGLELEKGTYNITATKGKQVGFADKVTVKDHGETTAEIKLTAGVEVQGKLLDKNNKAVKNTEVVFTTNPTFISKTDSAGTFKITLLPNKTYTVLAINPDKKSEGFKTIATDITIGSKDETIKDLIAPFAIAAASGGGGGGGGGGPQDQETADVSNKAELQRALNNSNIRTINFKANFEADISAERLINLNFNQYTLTGDVKINTSQTGEMTISGSADPSINGSLTVKTPNASITNKAKVSGGVIIQAVAKGTWNEEADGNNLDVQVANGGVINIIGNADSVTITSGDEGLNITVSEGGTVKTLTVNAEASIVLKGEVANAVIKAPVTVEGADKIQSAEIAAQGVKLDKAPQEYSSEKPVEIGQVMAKPKAAKPTADPPAGVVPFLTEVTLKTKTADAKIYYTLDGREPSTHSKLYDKPIIINKSLTIKAIAAVDSDDWDASSVLIAEYTLASEPEFNVISNVLKATVVVSGETK